MPSEIPPKLDQVTERNISELSQEAAQPRPSTFDPTPYRMEVDERMKSKYKNILDRINADKEQQQRGTQFQNITVALGLQNAKTKYNMERAEIIRKRKMMEDAQRAQMIGSILGLVGTGVGAYMGSAAGPQGAMIGASIGSQVGQGTGSMFSNSKIGE